MTNEDNRLFRPDVTQDSDPVECLGMQFENSNARREYFLEKLRLKLKDPDFRSIGGFPLGEDEDILDLSDRVRSANHRMLTLWWSGGRSGAGDAAGLLGGWLGNRLRCVVLRPNVRQELLQFLSVAFADEG